jgi:hypothetical protein
MVENPGLCARWGRRFRLPKAGLETRRRPGGLPHTAFAQIGGPKAHGDRRGRLPHKGAKPHHIDSEFFSRRKGRAQ